MIVPFPVLASRIGLGLALLVSCLPAAAQAIDPVHGKPGSLVLGIDQRIGAAPVDAAARQAALAVAGNILAVVRRNPAIASPVGYTVRIHRAFGKRSDWADFDSGLPFFAGVFGTLFAADAKPSPNAFKGADFAIYVNTVLQCPVNAFTHPLAKHPWLLDGKAPVIEGGRATGQFRGHVIYDGQCVVLSRHKEPPFLPLTRDQYVRLEISALQERLESTREKFAGVSDPNVRSALDSAVQQIDNAIAKRRQELDSMDPSTRSSVVFVQTGYAEAKLADPGDDGAIPLSVPNPAFFNQSLPPATVQAVSVFLPFLQPGAPPAGLPPGLPEDWRPATEKLRDQLDWATLEALLQ
jgi:hypothetical protein